MESCSLSSDELEELKRFTVVCLEVYAETAVQKMLEAEKLISQALDLRQEALDLFSRANTLALEYAAERLKPAKPMPEEDIQW